MGLKAFNSVKGIIKANIFWHMNHTIDENDNGIGERECFKRAHNSNRQDLKT